jgi:hypothetical protein
MFEVSSDIYFIVYDLYYVGQNDNLGARARPINWDGGSTKCITVVASIKGTRMHRNTMHLKYISCHHIIITAIVRPIESTES